MVFTLGQLAQAADVYVGTIRYYQRRGLMGKPAKPLNGARRYDENDARRLRFIKQAQALGFSLDDVGDLLALEDGQSCAGAEQLGTRQLTTVGERIAQLRRVEDALSQMVDRCRGNRGTVCCPLITALERSI